MVAMVDGTATQNKQGGTCSKRDTDCATTSGVHLLRLYSDESIDTVLMLSLGYALRYVVTLHRAGAQNRFRSGPPAHAAASFGLPTVPLHQCVAN